jgi:hypothetical protein
VGVTDATDALNGAQGDEDADAVMVKPAMVSVWKTSRKPTIAGSVRVA